MTRALVGLLLAAALLPACIEPDLGDVPFFCNNGDPKCPDGYSCVDGRCVREGASVAADTGGDTTSDTGGGPDLLSPWPDSTPDWLSPAPDLPNIKWDLGGMDLPVPTKDGWPPHLGCQSHQECASDPSNPCCCPMPLLPQFWACLPLCLNPFCL